MPLFENPSYFAVLNPYFFLLLHSIHSLDSSPPVFTYDLFFKTDTIGIMKTTVLIFIKKAFSISANLKRTFATYPFKNIRVSPFTFTVDLA